MAPSHGDEWPTAGALISEEGFHITPEPLSQRGRQLGYTWTRSSHLVSDNPGVNGWHHVL